ncbi:hypothetical protein CEXT_507741 [Caerostris extrusa]|uniref:Secreted protein n=1 Tax=Caerostris extrusa TaxID=172846 RepID=A0AAV4XDT6_CAEEX|nr:hypothetical protein CEXT_507741 [Caerostris extrusa]
MEFRVVSQCVYVLAVYMSAQEFRINSRIDAVSVRKGGCHIYPSGIGVGSGLSSSFFCAKKKMSPTRWLGSATIESKNFEVCCLMG